MTNFFYNKIENVFLNWPIQGYFKAISGLAIFSILYLVGNFPSNPKNY